MSWGAASSDDGGWCRQSESTRPHDVGELLHLILLAKDDGTQRPSVDAAPILELHALAEGLHDLAVSIRARCIGLVAQQISIDLHRTQLLLQVGGNR